MMDGFTFLRSLMSVAYAKSRATEQRNPPSTGARLPQSIVDELLQLPDRLELATSNFRCIQEILGDHASSEIVRRGDHLRESVARARCKRTVLGRQPRPERFVLRHPIMLRVNDARGNKGVCVVDRRADMSG